MLKNIFPTVFMAVAILMLAMLWSAHVQAGGTVTNCSDDSQFGSLLVGGGTVTFNCGTALINLSSTPTITANTTIDGGGLITLSGQNARQLFFVSASLTLRNIVLTNGFTIADGGAITNGGVLILENSTIRNSSAGLSGGAILNIGLLTITDSLLEGNRALNGGALFFRFPDARTTIVNSVLHDNHATGTNVNGLGGAILAWYSGPVTIEGSDIFSNSAAREGGGIYIYPNSSVTLNGSKLRNNTAVNGGGVYNSNGTATLTNVTLSGNGNLPEDPGDGGGVYNSNGTATLTNVTLSGNSARNGRGILHTSSTIGRILELKNSIVANSPNGGNCLQLTLSVASITSNGFNLSGDTSCVPFLNKIGDRNNQDPLLGPLANNGGPTLTHMPQVNPPPGSPAIDNGSGCPATDQRGAARPVGPACDIGAVEYGAKVPWLYLPLILS